MENESEKGGRESWFGFKLAFSIETQVMMNRISQKHMQ